MTVPRPIRTPSITPHSSADPHVIFNHNTLARFRLLPNGSAHVIEVVIRRDTHAVSGDAHVVADGQAAMAVEHAKRIHGAVRADTKCGARNQQHRVIMNLACPGPMLTSRRPRCGWCCAPDPRSANPRGLPARNRNRSHNRARGVLAPMTAAMIEHRAFPAIPISLASGLAGDGSA